MDDKLNKLRELKAQHHKLGEDITKLSAEIDAEVKAAINGNKKPRKKRGPTQQSLPLNGGP